MVSPCAKTCLNDEWVKHPLNERVEMNHLLRDKLVSMKEEDLRVRAELAADGSLFDGYHPRMEEVHRHNASRLREIIDVHGWPGHNLAGEDGAEAAWLIAQHAIGEPLFQRRCLELLQAAADAGDAPTWQAAFLEDRIRVFEGKPQRYATQFEIGDDGWPIPYQIEEPEKVDERHHAVGLESLAERLGRAEWSEPPDPETRARREREYQQWLRKVGWRE
jgi:uncharacterized protein DUF6624